MTRGADSLRPLSVRASMRVTASFTPAARGDTVMRRDTDCRAAARRNRENDGSGVRFSRTAPTAIAIVVRRAIRHGQDARALSRAPRIRRVARAFAADRLGCLLLRVAASADRSLAESARAVEPQLLAIFLAEHRLILVGHLPAMRCRPTVAIRIRRAPEERLPRRDVSRPGRDERRRRNAPTRRTGVARTGARLLR